MIKKRYRTFTKTPRSVRVEAGAGGELVLTLPVQLVEHLLWLSSDELQWQIGRIPHTCTIKNLSLCTLYHSRARRNLRTLSNALTDPANPLKRIVVESNSKKEVIFVLMSASTYTRLQNEKVVEEIAAPSQ